jgi:L-ribulose-5-phosphate 3-epimerase
MKRLKLGVCLESLGLRLRRALQDVERMGVTGVQVDAVGDLAPKNLSQTGRRQFLHVLRAHNLELAALGAPLRLGLDVTEGQEARIDYVRAVMSLSFELGARRVVVQAGRVPDDVESTARRRLTEALLALGYHGDRTGSVLAVEAGGEPAAVLDQFLASFDTGGLGVALNPAALLINGFDAYESARVLRRWVVYAQAQDARRSLPNRSGQEVALGHGDIDWIQYVSVLEEIEYRSWLTVRRDLGNNRLADVADGIKFLRRFLPAETG